MAGFRFIYSVVLNNALVIYFFTLTVSTKKAKSPESS